MSVVIVKITYLFLFQYYYATTNMQPQNWRYLIKLTLPVAMGYYAAGIAFGVLAVSAGLTWWLALLMSITVYTGAAQYAAIPLFAGGAGIFSITLSTLLINLRQLVYTVVMCQDLPKHALKRLYATASITDESFSLLLTMSQVERQRAVFRVNFLCQSYWVSATLIGILLGDQLNQLIPNLDFALPCLFVILAYEQFKHNKQLLPLIVAPIAFIVAKLFFPNWILLVAILFCGLVILLKHNFTKLIATGGDSDA